MYRVQWSGCGRELAKYEQALGSIPITKKKEKKEGESRERKKRERIQFHCPLSHCPYVPAKRIASYGDRITKTVCTANTTHALPSHCCFLYSTLYFKLLHPKVPNCLHFI